MREDEYKDEKYAGIEVHGLPESFQSALSMCVVRKVDR